MVVADKRSFGEKILESPLRMVGLPFWVAYRPLVSVRNFWYDQGWCPIFKVGVPVISVGNISLGGTGKTPLVHALVERLKALGRNPMVLSRGYRAKDGEAPDEAHLVGAPVIANSDRVLGARSARERGADCLVLDDGFQHRRIHRDLDIVCIDATKPFGRRDGRRGAVLPLGFLREGLAGLGRAGLAVVTRADQVSISALDRIDRVLQAHGLAVVHARHQPKGLRPLSGGDLEPWSSLSGRAVIAVCAIGNPNAFQATLESGGAEVIRSERFPDHHAYKSGDLRSAIELAQNKGATVVTTAKDAGKLDPTWFGSVPVKVVEVAMGFSLGEDLLQEALVQALAQGGSP